MALRQVFIVLCACLKRAGCDVYTRDYIVRLVSGPHLVFFPEDHVHFFVQFRWAYAHGTLAFGRGWRLFGIIDTQILWDLCRR